ncbi:MAG: glycosyltransferase family 4 protein [bacterium]|nr:glycosyltransferase family 4 protein [bacterium]
MQKKIKVCHLTSVHPSRDTRILYKECKTLAEAGYEVTLIAKNGEKDETVEGVRIISFPLIRNRILRILFSPLRMFRMAVKQKANLYHYHDPELLITGLLLKIFTRGKVIYDIHEDYTKNIKNGKQIKFAPARFIVEKAFACFEWSVSRLMSANVGVLPQWTQKYPRMAVVKNYPVPANNIPQKEPYLFTYVGNLGTKRSAVAMTEIAAQIIKRIPGAKFNIIGNFFNKNVKEKVMEQVNRHPGMTYQGFLPFPEVKKNLARAKYGFVLYSSIKYKENIPVKMYEYLANGVIAIFSSFDDFKYEVEEE